MNKISQQAEKLRTVVREANETEERLKVFHKIGELSDEQYNDYTERIIYVRKMLINLLKAVESQEPKIKEGK